MKCFLSDMVVIFGECGPPSAVVLTKDPKVGYEPPKAAGKPACWSPLKGDMGPNKYPRDIRCIWG